MTISAKGYERWQKVRTKGHNSPAIAGSSCYSEPFHAGNEEARSTRARTWDIILLHIRDTFPSASYQKVVEEDRRLLLTIELEAITLPNGTI